MTGTHREPSYIWYLLGIFEGVRVAQFFSFLCNVFAIYFLLTIVLFVFLRLTASVYPLGIFIFFLSKRTIKNKTAQPYIYKEQNNKSWEKTNLRSRHHTSCCKWLAASVPFMIPTMEYSLFESNEVIWFQRKIWKYN